MRLRSAHLEQPLCAQILRHALSAQPPENFSIEDAFGADADYAMLHKIYGAPAPDDSRYSPLQPALASIAGVNPQGFVHPDKSCSGRKYQRQFRMAVIF